MKKITVITLIVHLCISIIFSFDLFGGEYLGFGLTLLIIYGFTLPVIISGLSVGYTIYRSVKKSLNGIELFMGVSGVCVILTYILSASGILSGAVASSVGYIVLLIGTVAIVTCSIFEIFRTKHRQI